MKTRHSLRGFFGSRAVSDTINLYFPCVIDKNSPIPHLYRNIALYLDADTYEVTTLRTSEQGTLDRKNIREIPVGDANTLRRKVEYFRTSAKHFDIVHTGGQPTIHNKLTKITRARNPNLMHVHSLRVDLHPEYEFNDTLRKELVQKADIVTAVSHHTAQTARDRFDVNPEVIHNGIDVDQFSPDYDVPDGFELSHLLKSERPTFLFVGSFSDRKRVTNVVDVAESVPDADFILIGTGPQYERIQSREAEIANLYTTGYLTKQRLPPIYASADGLLFPSVCEGCPNVVLEAMASALPVVGYNATSMPELVVDGETGFLVEQDNVSALADVTQRLLDEDTARRLGRRGRERVLNSFQFPLILEQYKTLYEQL